MTQLVIDTPRVFKPLLAPARYKGAWGGRGSGKSHHFAESVVERSVIAKTDVVCVREVQQSLAQSVKKLLEVKIQAMGVGDRFEVLRDCIKSDLGGLIIFQGMQNHTAETIKSLEGYDIAWVEEAQSLSQRSLDLLRPTIRKPESELWFSWNPNFPTDPVDLLLRGEALPPDSVVVQSNYRDNPWLPAVLKAEIDYDQRRDPDKFAHVWLGEYQRNSESRVFRNWTIEEFDLPASTVHRLGADWGYAIDPSVLVRCSIDGKRLYVDYEAYLIGCEINQLPDLFDAVPDARKWFITADSARPETISYMQKHGFPRINAAIKGARSVEEGVAFLQSFDIVVHPRCQHVIDELTMYSYKTDPLTGRVLPILDDKHNHCFTGDTEILTHSGTCRIDSLPSTGEVMTRWGFKKYRNPRVTRRNAQVMAVTFSDGLTVRCTPDHLFATASGWISICELAVGSMIQSRTMADFGSRAGLPARGCTGTASSTNVTRANVTSVVGAVLWAANGCIARYGKRLSAAFQRGTRYIIATAIPQITPYQILNAGQLASIGQGTGHRKSANGREGIWPKPQGQQLQSGISRQQVGSGIAGWLKRLPGILSGSAQSAHASSVASSFSPCADKSSAVTIAKLEPCGCADVWCLTVPDAEEFALSNGAIVHNCIDSLRYACEGARKAGPAKLPPIKYQNVGIV